MKIKLIFLIAATIGASSIAVAQNPSAKQIGLSQVAISPISLTAIDAGIEVTPKSYERWVSQTDLTPAQVKQVLPEGKYTRDQLLSVFDYGLERRARGLVDFLDTSIFKTNTVSAFDKRSADIDWRGISASESLLADVAFFAALDNDRDRKFSENLANASSSGPDGAAARSAVYKTLSDARTGAARSSRAYRQLFDIVSSELRKSESERGIGLSFELRSSGKELATISPLSRANLQCAGATKQYPSFLLAQRRRDCSDQGICRIEAVATLADVSNDSPLNSLFKELRKNGREILDQCNINLTLLVDGAEVSRSLPGKFTSHVPVTFLQYGSVPQ